MFVTLLANATTHAICCPKTSPTMVTPAIMFLGVMGLGNIWGVIVGCSDLYCRGVSHCITCLIGEKNDKSFAS